MTNDSSISLISLSLTVELFSVVLIVSRSNSFPSNSASRCLINNDLSSTVKFMEMASKKIQSLQNDDNLLKQSVRLHWRSLVKKKKDNNCELMVNEFRQTFLSLSCEWTELKVCYLQLKGPVSCYLWIPHNSATGRVCFLFLVLPSIIILAICELTFFRVKHSHSTRSGMQ